MDHRHLSLALLFSCLLACDPEQGPGVPGDAGADGATALVDYPTYVARAIRVGCATSYDCCSAADRAMLLSGPWADYDTCVAENEAGIGSHTAQVVAMIESGALIFDAAGAASCLAVHESATCAERAEWIGRIDGPCADVLRGVARTGEACGGTTGTCASGICSSGVCAPLPRRGDECEGFVCDDGTVCRVDDVCGDRAAEGEPCRRHLQCEDGLYCSGLALGGAGSEGTCAPIDVCLGT